LCPPSSRREALGDWRTASGFVGADLSCVRPSRDGYGRAIRAASRCWDKLARSGCIILSFGACWPTGGHKKGPPLRNSTSLVYPMAFCELSPREARTLGVSLYKVQSKFRISKIGHFSLNFDRLGQTPIFHSVSRVAAGLKPARAGSPFGTLKESSELFITTFAVLSGVGEFVMLNAVKHLVSRPPGSRPRPFTAFRVTGTRPAHNAQQ